MHRLAAVGHDPVVGRLDACVLHEDLGHLEVRLGNLDLGLGGFLIGLGLLDLGVGLGEQGRGSLDSRPRRKNGGL